MSGSLSKLHAKVHNFGIYKKNGKRSILQLDFPGQYIYLIHRGHIKKTYSFDNLQHFDSEDGLHIVLKFKDCEFEFEADNTEEKYTICRLLSLLLDADNESTEGPITPGGTERNGSVSVLSTLPVIPNRVIKEAVLEKKGNTAITIWNKRRLKVTPGEFSYYKPGEEYALNIVQVWDDICNIERSGQTGFNITVRNRVYSFRLPHDQKSNNAHAEREEWIQALHTAVKAKRNTTMFFDSFSPLSGGLSSPEMTVFEFPSSNHIKSIDENTETEQEQQTVSENADGQTACDSIVGKQEVTACVSVRLSVVEKTEPLKHLPTSQRPRPPGFSRHGSTPHKKAPVIEESSQNGNDDVDFGAEGTIAAVRAKWEEKDKAVKASSAEKPTEKSTGNQKILGKEIHKVSQPNSTLELKIHLPEPEPDYPKIGRPSQNKVEIVAEKEPTEKYIDRPLPMAPAVAPALPPAPPPPLLNSKKTGVKLKIKPKSKLKQVHWTKINANTFQQTLWKGMCDATEKLNLNLLEEQFSLQDKEYTGGTLQPQGSEKAKLALLLDSKRATNIGIVFSGLKTDVTGKLKDALSSITELESFPAEKLKTIRRYQPTADDIEMYSVYKKKRDDLHPVDRFMMDLCEIPSFRVRLDLVINILDFPRQYDDLDEAVGNLRIACEELISSKDLVRVLEYLLAIGNFLNAHWTSGMGAHGFQISSIQKVFEIKGRNHHFTILNYLVDQIKQSDPDLLQWTSTLQHVPKCADVSVKAISAEVEVLKSSLLKIKRNMKIVRPQLTSLSKQDKKFQSDVQNFVTEYERKLEKLDSTCSKLQGNYHELLKWFGETPTRTSDIFFSSIGVFMERFQETRDKQSK